MKKIFEIIALCTLFAGCATSIIPEKPEYVDEATLADAGPDKNIYRDYGQAMASSDDNPLTVYWQDSHKAEIAEATKPSNLVKLIESDAAAQKMLAEVKEAYKTDQLTMMQIGAISQLVMCSKCPKAPAFRQRWTAALIAAIESTDDVYRKSFYLDQLRWCGSRENLPAIRKIKREAQCKHIREFAAQVEREIENSMQ